MWLATVCMGASLAQAQLPAVPGVSEFDWRFSIKANSTASSNIEARNICRKPQRFEIVMQGLPSFVRVLGEPGLLVAPGTANQVPVKFDSTGLSAGLHEGKVVVRCVTCRTEPTCTTDHQVLHIFMTVEPQVLAEFVPGRVLVTVPLDSAEDAKTAANRLSTTFGMKVEEVTPLNSANIALIVFSLPEGVDVLKKVAELGSKSVTAQPDYLYSANGDSAKSDSASGDSASSDAASSAAEQAVNPPAQLQYGPRLIGVDSLHGIVTGKGVKVALIDTGVDAAHPALAGKIVERNDVTGKGFTADVHGTLLAGIIAGEPKDGAGIAGIAPGAEILAIKACQPQTPQAAAAQCWSRTLARGLDLAIEKKAAVINMSLGGPGGVEDKLLKRMVDEAVGRGAFLVAAAGNDGAKAKPGFPAALPNVVAVTAVDSKDQLYPSATQGDFVALSAPGVEIVSTSPGGKLLVSSGTSLATAFVSGTAALALQQQPRLTPQSLKALLERTAQDLGPAGKDPQFGSGLVNACRAVAELKHDPKLCR